MENLDRTSPEIWPERSTVLLRCAWIFKDSSLFSVPGMTDFINNYTSSANTNKLPYSKDFTQEDNDYLHRKCQLMRDMKPITDSVNLAELASLTTAGLISKVKELHDIAYQLGVEESKEMTRGKYLNLFNKPKKNK